MKEVFDIAVGIPRHYIVFPFLRIPMRFVLTAVPFVYVGR